MTTPTLTMNAESAPTDATRALSAVSRSTAEVMEFPDLTKPRCDCLSRELIRDHRTMELITKKDAEAKMASFLINLSGRFKERGYSASRFNLSMKRSEIGSHLGLAVETVSRILTRFQEDGLLRVERRRVQIYDHSALQALAGCRLSH